MRWTITTTAMCQSQRGDMTGARASVEVQHRFWRFRHDQVTDSIVFETSTDGTAWTARRTDDREIPITALRVEQILGIHYENI